MLAHDLAKLLLDGPNVPVISHEWEGGQFAATVVNRMRVRKRYAYVYGTPWSLEEPYTDDPTNPAIEVIAL